MTYDYVITKPPLEEETLMHYGVQGMRWGRRKRELRIAGLSRRQARRAIKLEKKIDRDNNFIKQHGKESGLATQDFRDSVRDNKKELKGLMKNANKTYHVQTSRSGRTKILDQNNKRMSRGDQRFMEKMMKKEFKGSDKEKYREYKRNKKTSKQAYAYIGKPSLAGYALTGALNSASSAGRKLAKSQINKSVTEYTNSKLDELKKKSKK